MYSQTERMCIRLLLPGSDIQHVGFILYEFRIIIIINIVKFQNGQVKSGGKVGQEGAALHGPFIVETAACLNSF